MTLLSPSASCSRSTRPRSAPRTPTPSSAWSTRACSTSAATLRPRTATTSPAWSSPRSRAPSWWARPPLSRPRPAPSAFIGGVANVGGLIERFEAGFQAGARTVNPDIEIISSYVTQAPDFAGFNAPDRGKEIALAMYEEGADIVYHAAGGTGAGLFLAAQEHSDNTGSKVWAIGVDSDQYHTAGPGVQDYILTSMLKRVDVSIFEMVRSGHRRQRDRRANRLRPVRGRRRLQHVGRIRGRHRRPARRLQGPDRVWRHRGAQGALLSTECRRPLETAGGSRQ